MAAMMEAVPEMPAAVQPVPEVPAATKTMPEMPAAVEPAMPELPTAAEAAPAAASDLLDQILAASQASAVGGRTGELSTARKGHCRGWHREMGSSHQQGKPKTLDDRLFHIGFSR